MTTTFEMRRRRLCLFGSALLMAMLAAFSVAVAAQSSAPAAKAAKPAAKSLTTPWGDPDLQGVYDVAGIKPLQRPKQFADREFLTEAEAAALEKQAYDVNHNEVEIEEGDTGYYNRFWRDPGTKIVKVVPNRRTSMIIDPPDGRLPPYTPQAQKLRDKMAEILKKDGPMVFNRIGPTRLARDGSSFADSYLDRDTIERCMSASLPKLLGAGNNSGVQIVQGPGFVVMNYENRDTRIIPLTGARTCRHTSGCGWAIHAVTGRARRWWSTPPLSPISRATSRPLRAREGGLPQDSCTSSSGTPGSTRARSITRRRSTIRRISPGRGRSRSPGRRTPTT